MGPILKAKQRSEDFITSFGMEYVIVRPGGYSQKELSGKVAFGEGGNISGLIKREQIAKVCVDALTHASMKNRTFEVIDAATVKDNKGNHFVEP